MNFDPNAAAAIDSGIFGLPFGAEDSKIILLPVPWEVTTSYGAGTAQGPQAILQASKQMDLYDAELGDFYQAGICMVDESQQIIDWNQQARISAERIISETAKENDSGIVDSLSVKMNNHVYQQTKSYLEKGKIVGVIGGDHSVPFGAIKAYIEKYPDMGILHIDAHADLRQKFEGFTYSHASIMYNVMEKTPLKKLVQVGVRDYCDEEAQYISQHPEKIHAFFDANLQELRMIGKAWNDICQTIILDLPKQVYVSFDIDGLDPQFCPNTGTPVPGGLSYYEVIWLFRQLIKSGRQIIGFDLNEVSIGVVKVEEVAHPSQEWDANIAARLLYKLCGFSNAL